ncbi:hypothetical protein JOB18_019918 [Solea senegalensis]|uniref:Uncharacterized protein n=1 Tax=Solea senegalensis TaxID=28829 RepID=A0AAV6SFS2_SOLSE|nr:hypothetical protein JOB18_019918 [Solea senegalensis]
MAEKEETGKDWFLQGLYITLHMWPVSINKVSLCHARHLQRLVNAQVRNWGLLRCLRSIGLSGNGTLSLEMTLTESRDPMVRGVTPTLATGRRQTKTTIPHFKTGYIWESWPCILAWMSTCGPAEGEFRRRGNLQGNQAPHRWLANYTFITSLLSSLLVFLSFLLVRASQ